MLRSVPVSLQTEAHSPLILMERPEMHRVAETVILLIIGK